MSLNKLFFSFEGRIGRLRVELVGENGGSLQLYASFPYL